MDNLYLSQIAKIAALQPVLALSETKGAPQHAQNALLQATSLTTYTQEPTTETRFSAIAQQIDYLLHAFKSDGLPTKIVSKTVLTHSPQSTSSIVSGLKNAISQSGLFYESHLKDFMEGQRTLTEIKLEPQNQPNVATNTLIAQQLNVLEQQKVIWHGTVWPNQAMQWEIAKRNHQDNKYDYNAAETPIQGVESALTLELPNLGKVTAKLSLLNGRMRIGFFASELNTLSVLKSESNHLVAAFQRNGQPLDGVLVSLESNEQTS